MNGFRERSRWTFKTSPLGLSTRCGRESHHDGGAIDKAESRTHNACEEIFFGLADCRDEAEK
jgi:hypothetical protein